MRMASIKSQNKNKIVLTRRKDVCAFISSKLGDVLTLNVRVTHRLNVVKRVNYHSVVDTWIKIVHTCVSIGAAMDCTSINEINISIYKIYTCYIKQTIHSVSL